MERLINKNKFIDLDDLEINDKYMLLDIMKDCEVSATNYDSKLLYKLEQRGDEGEQIDRFIDSYDKRQLFNLLEKSLVSSTKITEHQAVILILRFGLVDGKERGIKEIANIFNVSYQAITQKFNVACKKLKASLYLRRVYFENVSDEEGMQKSRVKFYDENSKNILNYGELLRNYITKSREENKNINYSILENLVKIYENKELTKDR